MPRGYKNDIASVAQQVEIVETGCWEWQGYRLPEGYGQVSWNGAKAVVHHIVWEYLVCPVPKGYVLDHLCRNPPCCNVAHLEIVTQQENIRRGEVGRNSREKTLCPRGHPYDMVTISKGRGPCRRCSICFRASIQASRDRQKAEAKPCRVHGIVRAHRNST